jgi:hypothetical protein
MILLRSVKIAIWHRKFLWVCDRLLLAVLSHRYSQLLTIMDCFSNLSMSLF